MDKLAASDRVIAKINEHFARLNNASHVPRTKPLPKGQVSTIFNDCDPSCPTCVLERKYAHRLTRLGDVRRAALMKNAQDSYWSQERRRKKAREPRNRKPNLWLRGFKRFLKEFPEITPKELRNLLPRTYDDYDDENVELRLEGDDIVVEDLKSGDTQSVKKSSQSVYLQRARNS